jgi:hypothetical protein
MALPLNGIVYQTIVGEDGLDPMQLYARLRDLYLADEWPQFRLVIIDPSYVHRIRRSIEVETEGRTMGQIWRREIQNQIMEDSENPIWRPGWQIVVQLPTDRGYSRRELLQFYRDGDTHCVLTPIRRYYERRRDSCAGEATQAKCRTYLQRLDQLEKAYRSGVPDSAMEFVATRLGVRIRISDPFGENTQVYNDACLRGKIFEFRNTRFNHVEEIVCDTEVETQCVQGLLSTLGMLRSLGKFYLYRQTAGTRVPTRIESEWGRFTLEDPDATIFQAARDKYCLDGYAIDAQKEPALAKFLADGLRVTSHAQFHVGEDMDDPSPEYNVLDLSAAYTRGAECGDYFQGYLVGISNVRVVTDGIDHVRAHPGIYSVHGVTLDGCTERVHDYATQLHLRAGASLILPSPELLWWWDHGVRFDVRAGAWGAVLPDIDWEECRLLEKGTGPLHGGLSRYKVWCGQLGYSNNGRKSVYLPGDARWAAVLASRGYHASFYAGDGDICVKLPTKRTPELKHMFAFITSYTRIHVLNKLMEFDPQDVRGVMLDAIVYAGPEQPDLAGGLWVHKPTVHKDVLVEYGKDGWYGLTGIWQPETTDAFITAGATPLTAPLLFLEGAGGSGKSHSVLADAGFRDVLFAAPTWSLVCFMMRKYNVAGTTAHRLAGTWRDVDEEGNEVISHCRPYHEEYKRYPAVVFVDEATMLDKDMLLKIAEIYKGKSQVIFAGDIRVTGIPADKPPVWFQCRNRTRVFDPRAAGCTVHTYLSDYRASGELVALKQQLRERMLEVFLGSTAEDPGDDAVDAYEVQEAARTLFASQVCTAATCAASYAKGDTILVGTHDLADEWAETLKDKDCRYRITSHSAADVAAAQRGEDVSLTGDIVEVKGTRAAVFALAFTIHSFQGKTFTGRTLWIDARRAWDYAMLYTAISRCQTISQIRLFFE